MFGIKLVDDVKNSLGWFSIQALSAVAGLSVAWATVPDELKVFIPPVYMPYVVGALAVSGIAGRLIDQGKKT